MLFVGLGETDDWAHSNDYPGHLDAAHSADQYLRILWETVQSLPEYRDSTTIIFTADHGRGNAEKWSDHGADIPESRETWFAVIGPDTAALGERNDSKEIRQTQFAATPAALLGEDFQASEPRAGAPIGDVFGRFRNDCPSTANNCGELPFSNCNHKKNDPESCRVNSRLQ